MLAFQSCEVLVPITLKVDVLWDATSCMPNVVDDYMSGSSVILVYVPACTVERSSGR